MIYLELLLGFLQVGLFSFGGAYGAIPLIRDVVMSYGWMDAEAFTNLIAVSESTPGPIMVNMATYIGSTQAGFFGALLATAAVVLPSFVIILLLTALLRRFIRKPAVQAALGGAKPAMVGIVTATGIILTCSSFFTAQGDFSVSDFVLVCVLALVYFGQRILFAHGCIPQPMWLKKPVKPLSPIGLIVLAAVLGMLCYGLR